MTRGLRRPARAPGHDAPAAAGVAVQPGEARRRPGHPRPASDTFDIKANALVPVVNIARWAALSVGSAVLPTTERLRAAAGSAMLPDEQAHVLIEVFDVLQRLRLRYQLRRARGGPSDRPTSCTSTRCHRSTAA